MHAALIVVILSASFVTSFARPGTLGVSADFCKGDVTSPRVVHVRMYSRSRLTETDFVTVLDTTNRVWQRYGVTVQPGTGPDAVVVVVSAGGLNATWFGPTVLGTTMFVEGHAKGNIHLSLEAAELLADTSVVTSVRSRTSAEREAILRRILGVALAHEMGHYLLDSTHHSSAGLLQSVLSVRDMVDLHLSHLGLTDQQQRQVCMQTSRASGHSE
jgi:hypothetical protein